MSPISKPAGAASWRRTTENWPLVDGAVLLERISHLPAVRGSNYASASEAARLGKAPPKQIQVPRLNVAVFTPQVDRLLDPVCTDSVTLSENFGEETPDISSAAPCLEPAIR
jgi:hypothetical protein